MAGGEGVHAFGNIGVGIEAGATADAFYFFFWNVYGHALNGFLSMAIDADGGDAPMLAGATVDAPHVVIYLHKFWLRYREGNNQIV